MNKDYKEPEYKVLETETQDVITTSTDPTPGSNTNPPSSYPTPIIPLP